jgi:tetratricopeptide (TPR) repeat protein/UDP-2,3-diacylglucosamine pyrophosphatase LpxH
MTNPRLETVTWLHFSDLHFRSRDKPDVSLTALLRRIEQEAADEDGLHPDLLFCSGDIADEGKTEDYGLAAEFFSNLLASTRLTSKKRVCIVPGNHDVDLGVDKTQTKALQQAFMKDENKARESFRNPATLEILITRFHGFQSFCTDFLEQPFNHFDNYYFAVVIPVDGLKIGFIGINSAWFCEGGKDDDRHMFLGISIVKEAFAKLESQGKSDITIVMLHHPIDWLHEHERDDVWDLLLEKADVVLTGHIHRGRAYAVITSPEGRKVLFLNVGATREIEQRPQRAFFVRADVSRKSLRVYPITFANGLWEKDTRLFPGMKGDCEIFDLMTTQKRATFKVGGTYELEIVANLTPFMENPAAGKFIKEKTWDDIRSEVDFSKLQPLDLTTTSRMFIIKGKAGMGKSTYMLWSLDRSLQDASWPFRRIVFLHPEYYDLWADELYDCEPEKTLIVIDALKRGTDTDAPFRFIDRCLELQRLAFEGKRVHEKLIGPFKILATIRDEEYYDLIRQPAFEWVSAEVFEITPEKLDLRKILEKLLTSHKIPYTIPVDREEEVIEKLRTKSYGSPFYVRHLVAELSRRNVSFSESILEEYPPGMVNLIWHTIKKTYYVEADYVIPFLLLLLSRTNKPYSDQFLSFLVERLAQTQKREVAEKITSLERFYFQDFQQQVGPTQNKNFTLNSHWKESLEIGLRQPENVEDHYKDVILAYKRIEDTQFRRLVEKITNELEIHLKEGFKDTADAFLCVDLAKLGNDGLEFATGVYSDFCSSSELPKDYIGHVQNELFELWISNAWKYRAVYDDEKVVACYENAFEKLGVRSDFKQLHSYAHYMQKRILPRLQDGTPEFRKCREKIERIYNEVIVGQLNQNVKDPISYQALALFYAEIGADEKAEKAFKECLEMDAAHIPSRQAYAIFLKGRGKREWVRDTRKALEYYRASEDQFRKSIEILEKIKEKLSQKEVEKYETRLLNAYALFLIDKTSWERDFDQRTKIDKEVDNLFDTLIKKYPHHGQSVTAYSNFLMRYARILEEYKGGKNLEKAERLLKDFIEFEKNGKERSLSYFMALHILALYCYKIGPSFYKRPPNMEEAEKHLKESSKSFDPHHNSVAYNELGQLYVRWADNLRKTGDTDGCNEKMNLAKEAYEKAMEIIPENQQSATHLSRVYFSYAFYMRRVGDTPKSLEYTNRALEIAQKFAYVPFGHYFALTSLGDEMLENNDMESARVVFTEARKIGERLGINPSYSVFKLGEIFRRKGEIKEALEYYVLSAKLENTSEGWGTRRDSIKRLMHGFRIKKITAPEIHYKCIQARLECSKQAWQLDQCSAKNCGDYGEDLLETREFEKAIPILEKGACLIQQTDELSETDKRKKLSWFYEKIGFCYKDQGKDLGKAEEYLLRAAETEDSAIAYFRAADWMFDLQKFEKVLIAFQKFVEKFASCEEKERIFPNMADGLKRAAISYGNWYQEHRAALVWKDYADVSSYSNYQEGFNQYSEAGNRLIEKKRFLEARECFLKALRLNPISGRTLSRLGYVSKMLQRWEACVMCSQKAFEIGGDARDEELYKFCQQESKKRPRTSLDTVEATMDKAILKELSDQYEYALECYSDILCILERQSYESKARLSVLRFIADAFWALGRKDEALGLYEKIKHEATGHEKMIVETIIWLMKK